MDQDWKSKTLDPYGWKDGGGEGSGSALKMW